MLDNSMLTDRLYQIIKLAREEAVRYSRCHIGTEHLLLALMRDGSGLAAKLLVARKLTLPGIRELVEKRTPGLDALLDGSTQVPQDRDRLPFTPNANRAFELAQGAAYKLGSSIVATEHLLLGLLKETDGTAAQVLSGLGMTLKGMWDEVSAICGGGNRMLTQHTKVDFSLGVVLTKTVLKGKAGEDEEIWKAECQQLGLKAFGKSKEVALDGLRLAQLDNELSDPRKAYQPAKIGKSDHVISEEEK